MKQDFHREHWSQALGSTAESVLESMFFSMIEELPETTEPPESIAVDLPFEGSCRGNFRIHLSPEAASTIACSFLALDDESEMESGQRDFVIAELANMVCGATLSHGKPAGDFKLGSPAVHEPAQTLPSLDAESGGQGADGKEEDVVSIRRDYRLDDCDPEVGRMSIFLRFVEVQ